MLPDVVVSPAPALPFWHIMPSDSDLQKIRKLAYARIVDKATWCYGDWARNQKGRGVPAEHATAVRFCARGALRRAASDLGLPEHAWRNASTTIMPCLDSINDIFGHRVTLALFRRAILRAQ